MLFISFFLRFYLFIHERQEERERQRQRQRQREKQAPCREPDVGLNPGSPGTWPRSKGGAKPLRHPGIPVFCFDRSYPNDCEVISHCGLLCISLIISDVEHLIFFFF